MATDIKIEADFGARLEIERHIRQMMAEWYVLDRWIERGKAYAVGAAQRRHAELETMLDDAWGWHEQLENPRLRAERIDEPVALADVVSDVAASLSAHAAACSKRG